MAEKPAGHCPPTRDGLMHTYDCRAKTKPHRRGRTAVLGALVAVTALAGCFEEDPDPNPSVRLFHAMYAYPTEAKPFAVAVADLNGDTRLDIATANREANSVSVLLAKEGGGFDAAVSYPVGETPRALAVADLDGDTLPDLIAANNASDDLSVLLGMDAAAEGGKTGAGAKAGYAPELRVPLAEGAQPLALAAGDFDEDMIPDLVTADNGLAQVSVLRGLGAGDFEASVAYAVGAAPRSVLVADLDLDGHEDLVTANRDTNDVSLLYGNGDGTFEAAIGLQVGENPRMVAAADLNRDAWPDLITTNPGSGDMSVMLGLGNGDFAEEQRTVLDFLPTRFVLEDFDADGKLDLAALLFSPAAEPYPLGMAAVYPGDGRGAFGEPRIFGVGIQALDILAEDLDADARVDLVIANTEEDKVSVIYGRGGGPFATDERFAVGRRPRMVRVADMNRDIHLDLVVANLDSKDLSILLGRGDGTFEPQIRTAVSDIPRDIAIGHLNGDINPDVVATNFAQSRVSVFLGLGDGTFQAERRFSVRESGNPYSAEPRSVALADLNGDGKLDIITGNANTDSIAVLLGQGNGNFGAATEFEAGNFPLDIHVADINGDQALDVVFASTNDPDNPNDQAQSRVVRLLGRGDGSFDEETTQRYETGGAPRGMVLTDLDNDGNHDAITAHPGNDRIYILEGRGAGKFMRGELCRSGEGPNSVAVAELNGDGLLDIVTTNNSESISVLLGRGDLRYSGPYDYTVGADPIAGVLADLDQDGTLDCVVANRITDDVSVLMGVPQ